MGKFIESSEEENVDFIIQLGDFCMPLEKNQAFLNVWNSFNGPSYHVLGNHDMDISSKAVFQDFLGMEKSYYSFDFNNFHFVVLDANFFNENENVVSYESGNYYSHPESRCYIPETQIEWLKSDLIKTKKRTIVFTHQSLEHTSGVKNRMEVREVFSAANKKSKKVIACICGHDHEDRYTEIDGIHYIGVNSTSYTWVGRKLEYSGRFPKSIEDKYSNLKYTIPYEDAVFATIEINSKGTMEIRGIESDFISPGPKELGSDNESYSAEITSRILNF